MDHSDEKIAIGKTHETSIPSSTIAEKEFNSNGSSSPIEHAAPEVVGVVNEDATQGPPAIISVRRKWFGYVKTKEFWVVLVLGQILSLCLTSTNTFTGLLQVHGASIPAFQTFMNYALLNLIFTPYTMYKYGFKGWTKVVLNRGWKYIIFAFVDVEGNYFVVLAYRYTNILSAQLINFTSIVVVVIISFLFLKVRYHWTQILGIIICVGGVGVLIGSDRITGSTSLSATNQVKGDLFMLLAATMYGFSNIFQEFLVSKMTVFEVLGQLGWWGMIINGVQSAIFDRQSFRDAVWNGTNGGYLSGYTLLLFLFYILTPVFMRLSSAAFFNISLLTGAFWGVIIGVKVFHYSIYYLYPIAFVMIILGLFLYFIMSSVLGEANKPWLGENQELGVSGLGTGRRKIEKTAQAHGGVAIV